MQVKFVIVMSYEAARSRCRLTASQLISSLRWGHSGHVPGSYMKLPLRCVGMAPTHDDGLSESLSAQARGDVGGCHDL